MRSLKVKSLQDAITEITEIGYGLVRSEKDTEGHRRCISHVSRWKVGEGTYLL